VESVEDLRKELVSYVKKKFYTRRNIADMADEVVNQAFLDALKAPDFHEGRYNFGYMSVVCIRVAYKIFHRGDNRGTVSFDLCAPLIDEESFVAEIERAADTALILQSLQTLKQIEQIIIRERYYGAFSFREIGEKHGINLNTVLSHHRRAMEKLRPVFTKYFPERIPKYHYGGLGNEK